MAEAMSVCGYWDIDCDGAFLRCTSGKDAVWRACNFDGWVCEDHKCRCSKRLTKPSVLQSLSQEEYDALPDLSHEEVMVTLEAGREARREAEAATPRRMPKRIPVT